jgi:putative transposase
VERGTGRIVAAVVRCKNGKWQVAFTCEVIRQVPNTRPPDRIIGIDVDVSTLYTGASPDGEHVLEVKNPRRYVNAQRKLAKAQRVASRCDGPRKGHTPSNRWKRSNARVQNIHEHVANQRKNLIHETTTMLAKDYDVIVVGDLHVAGMVQNHSLAKHIYDASWGEFVRQLEYKTTWYGFTLVKAPRFYASSKTCSSCGVTKAKLSLDERMYHCGSCGLEIDRDFNATINLARQSWTSEVSTAGTSSVAGRGGEGKTKAIYVAKAHPVEASTEPPPVLVEV